MKFICTQENFHNALAVVSRVASKSANLPILSNVMCETKNNNLVISATNLEMGLRAVVRGRVEEEGILVVPARLLDECVALMPKGNINLHSTHEALTLNAPGYENKIHLVSFEEFPLFPHVEEKEKAIIPIEELKEIFRATVFAASFDETRPELSGILLSIKKHIITAAATDSYRLAERALSVPSVDDFPHTILPLRTVQEIVKILSSLGEHEIKEVATIILGEHQFALHAGDFVLVSRIIDGEYPPYQDIVPSSHETQGKVAKQEIEQAMRAAGLFSKSGINDVTLHFSPGEGIKVKASNMQVGENISTVIAEVEGTPQEVVLNWKYFMEGLQSMESNEVVIELTNQASPVMIKPFGVQGHLYLIMPIRQ